MNECWTTKEKVIPFNPPQPLERGTGEEEKRKEIVTLGTLQKALEQQRTEMRSEMMNDLKQTQYEMMERQREMIEQLMEGLVNNLGQMLQAFRHDSEDLCTRA